VAQATVLIRHRLPDAAPGFDGIAENAMAVMIRSERATVHQKDRPGTAGKSGLGGDQHWPGKPVLLDRSRCASRPGLTKHGPTSAPARHSAWPVRRPADTNDVRALIRPTIIRGRDCHPQGEHIALAAAHAPISAISPGQDVGQASNGGAANSTIGVIVIHATSRLRQCGERSAARTGRRDAAATAQVRRTE
jgi:hypothetical protein